MRKPSRKIPSAPVWTKHRDKRLLACVMRPRYDHRPRHLQVLEWIGRGLEVVSREVEVHGRVRQVGLAQQKLNRPQVSARFQRRSAGGLSRCGRWKIAMSDKLLTHHCVV